MTQPTQTGTYFELDPIIGWRASTARLSEVKGIGLAVDCVPGQPQPFASGLANLPLYPVALAYESDTGKLHVLDDAINRVKVIDLPPGNKATTVMGFGGNGSQPRQLYTPRGLAFLADDSYVIADTGNHQVKIFSNFPNALLAVWGSGRPGNGPRDFHSPWKIAADPCGLIYIADRGNGRVQRIHRDGNWLTPIKGFQSPQGLALRGDGLLAVVDKGNVAVLAAGHTQPSQTLPVPDANCITFDADGYLYVGTSTALIYKFAPTDSTTGSWLFVELDIKDVTSLVNKLLNDSNKATQPLSQFIWAQFDSTAKQLLSSPNSTLQQRQSALILGLNKILQGNLIYEPSRFATVSLRPETQSLISQGLSGEDLIRLNRLLLEDAYPQEIAWYLFRSIGIGVTGMDAQFIDISWTPPNQLVGILLVRGAPRPQMWTISTCGAYVRDGGVLTTQTLDSGIDKCSWHRIELEADIPEGAIISVTTQTAQSDIWATGSPFQPDCSSFSYSSQDCPLSLIGKNPDCLVQSLPGRYLRLQLSFKTNQIVSPLLRAIRVHFPRQSYLQYLPAIYQEDDESRNFLDRFLSIFQTTFDGFDRRIDDIWMMFDPMSVPDEWYSWLAAWLALPINPLWSDQERRDALKNAGKLYPMRGTPAGIEKLVKEYAGIDVRLVEHFRLRQFIELCHSSSGDSVSDGRLWSRDYYQRLQVGVYSRIGYFRLTDKPESDIEPLSWGANEFSVFFDCEPYCIAETSQKVAQIVEREKPAHTKANYCPVLPRMRIELQSTVGIDTRIGIITPLLLGTTGALGYDSILGCSETETQILKHHSTLRPRLDINSQLL